MKKIRAPYSNKDRIHCVHNCDHLQLYYQTAGTSAKDWLMAIPSTPSVLRFFQEHGRRVQGNAFSLTLCELYRFGRYPNYKIQKLFDRLPGQVTYLLQS